MLNNFLTNFYFSWHSLLVSGVSTIIFFVGLFIFIQHRKAAANISFFLICLCINLWLFGISFVYAAKDPVLALTIYRKITFLGVSFISTSVYFFSVVWLNLGRRKIRNALIGFLGSIIFYSLGLFHDTTFPGVYHYFWGYYPQYGRIAQIFLLFFFGYFFAAFYNFVRVYQHETALARKKQIKLIAIAFLISFTGSVDYLPKLSYFPIYPIGYLCVFTWIMMVAYSIIRYKVMDIETVIHRTLMWAALSSLVFLPLGGTLYYFKNLLTYLHPVLSAVFGVGLFLLFMMYAKTIQPWIDHIFQRRKHDLESALTKFNDNLVHLKGLDDLSRYIAQTIREILYVDKVQVFLRESEKKNLIRIDALSEGTMKVPYGNAFVRWLEKEDQLALSDFVDLDPKFQDVKAAAKDFFRDLDAKVAIPLVLSGELLGLINLGQKANLKHFRAPELTFLSELRRAATIALSNSLRLIEMQESLRHWNEELEEKVRQRTRELEEAQKQLVQAEKLATIGTLAGGVAHEINNPLTAVLTNAQMLKMSATESDDRESIQLIEEGAKRCQAIVQKLMKYARKPIQEELMRELDLNQVIENVLAFLNYQLEQDNIRLIKHLKILPKIKGVANELEQVFTNIVLNAKDAIKAGKGSGTIEITTFEKNGALYAQIQDDGVGIPKEHLTKIFDPFFTTKDVGKGTGLGLSITYGIIEKHGGKIEVESEPGHGSTFTVSLAKLNER